MFGYRHLPFGVAIVGALNFYGHVSSGVEAPGDCSDEADDLVGHLLLASVAVVFVGSLVMNGIAKGWIGVKGSIVPVLGWGPSAGHLLMRHGVIRDSEGPGRNRSYN